MAKKGGNITEIEKKVHFGATSGAVMEVTRAETEPDAVVTTTSSNKKWALWGTDNNYPQKLIDKNMSDGASAGALRFKIAAHYGAGSYLYREQYEGEKRIIEPVNIQDYPEIEDFFFFNQIENFLQGIITDYEWFNMCPVEYVMDSDRTRFIRVQRIKMNEIRTGKKNKKTGLTEHYYISGHWPDPYQGQYAQVRSMDFYRPDRHRKSIYVHNAPSPDKIYYHIPEWQSNMKWIEVASKIPQWIDSNISNGMNIRWHVEIPEEYFPLVYPQREGESEEAWHKRLADEEETLKKNIDSYLAGEKNAAKTFYSKFAVDPSGNPLPGWKLTPLKPEIYDKAWLDAYGTAAAAIATAHGVHPSLQGLILKSGLGTGSASDVREAFNYYLQLRTVIPRQTTTEWFEIVKRVNGWPRELRLGYRNIILQTLNENKSGTATEGEPAPTTSNTETEEETE